MNQGLIHRFDAVVKKTPEAVAVVDNQKVINYSQLSELSISLAHKLADSGAEPGNVIALLCDRSLEWVVGCLAILRIGAVYLPLPPEIPRERRLLLMREAEVRHILRDPNLDGDMENAAVVIDIDTALTVHGEGTVGLLPYARNLPSDRACVLFTSGTTGMPKGVMVRQSSIVRLVVDTNYIEFSPSEAVAFASNTAFDAVTFEVWGALLNGGQLVVIPSSTLLSPSAFETAVRMHSITILFLTTELFNRIARARPSAFQTLKYLIFGGEKANVECVRAVLESKCAPKNLVHAYGPTECTTFSSCDRVTKVPLNATSIPIGTQISGYKIHLLDDQLRSVRDGDEGEICISGDGLAEGYLNNTEETEKAFQTLAIDGIPTRIYRTGDRARRRSDGLLEFIGRHDGQIKLRGFRIEIAEIEAVLSSHPDVRDAVVIAYRGPGDSVRLGGCLLMSPHSTEKDRNDIHAFIAKRLPAPMVPQLLRCYEAFPLTDSKKVDRQKLRADLSGAFENAQACFKPNDAVEKKLAAIWQLILGHPPHLADEDFFDAGGDSLQAVDLQLRIENAWKMPLSPSLLIEVPTFREIANHIRSRESLDVRPVVWLTRGQSRPLLVCMPGVYGHIFFFRNLASLWPTDKGLCAMPSRHLAPSCDRRLLTIEEIAEENLSRLEEEGLGSVDALAGYSFGGLVAYEMARLMAKRGQVPSLVIYDTAAEGEQFRGLPLTHRLRLTFTNILYRRRLRHGLTAPALFFNPASANLVAVERYKPKPYSGGMLLIRSALTNLLSGVNPETMGWDRFVEGQLVIKSVTAGHGDFFKPPHVSEIAATTIEYLKNGDARWR